MNGIGELNDGNHIRANQIGFLTRITKRFEATKYLSLEAKMIDSLLYLIRHKMSNRFKLSLASILLIIGLALKIPFVSFLYVVVLLMFLWKNKWD